VRSTQAVSDCFIDDHMIFHFSSHYLKKMCCYGSEGEQVNDASPLIKFVTDSDFKALHHSNMMAWDEVAFRRLERLAYSMRPPVRVMACWVYCHLAANREQNCLTN
jgi:hypothetical protein